MIELILLQIDIIFYENKYKYERIPLKKYYYWKMLQICYERWKSENNRRNKEYSKFSN